MRAEGAGDLTPPSVAASPPATAAVDLAAPIDLAAQQPPAPPSARPPAVLAISIRLLPGQEELTERAGAQRAWFQAPIGDDGAAWPIDRVVAWSRTKRGGKEEDKQENLFAGSEGCMRWGLCETGK